MPEQFIVTYALTKDDIVRNEFGRHKPMPLNKALKVAQNMLSKAYMQVTITKE